MQLCIYFIWHYHKINDRNVLKLKMLKFCEDGEARNIDLLSALFRWLDQGNKVPHFAREAVRNTYFSLAVFLTHWPKYIYRNCFDALGNK